MLTSETSRTRRNHGIRAICAPPARTLASRAFLAALALTCAATLFSAAGCQTTKKVELPKVVAEDATASEIIAAINANSAKIQSVYSSTATIGAQDQPGWANCQLFFQRDKKLRVVGSAAVLGRVVDCGCDGSQFWFWSKLLQDADKLFVCKLDQYQGSALANIVPVDPTWFPEAIGVLSVDEANLEGSSKENNLILLTVKAKHSDGVYRKRIYVEPRTAAIRRQDVQDPNGNTIVSVVCNEHQLVSVAEGQEVVMPRRVEIRCETTGDVLLVNLGTPVLNDSSKFDDSVFQTPTARDLSAKETVDLGKLKTSTQAESTTTSAASNTQASLVPPPNFQPVRNAAPLQTTAADRQSLAQAASIQPTLPDPPAATPAATGADVVPFPTTAAVGQPAAQPAAQQAAPQTSIAIQPTTAPVSSGPYVVSSPDGPQLLSAADSTFAQNILNRQDLQNAQTALTGVPAQNQQPAQTNLPTYANAQQPANAQNLRQGAYAYQNQNMNLNQGVQAQNAQNANLGAQFAPVQNQTVPNAAAATGFNQYQTPQTAQAPNAGLQAPQQTAAAQGGFNNYANPNPVNQTSAVQPVQQSPAATTPVPSFDDEFADDLLDDVEAAVPAQPADPFDADDGDFPELLPL